jgi:hypothetical protein
LQYLDSAIIQHLEDCTEDIVEFLAKKTGHHYQTIYDWFEDIIRSDAQHESMIAKFVAYRILKTDSIGSSYANFNKKPYCNLGINEHYLKGWE